MSLFDDANTILNEGIFRIQYEDIKRFLSAHIPHHIFTHLYGLETSPFYKVSDNGTYFSQGMLYTDIKLIKDSKGWGIAPLSDYPLAIVKHNIDENWTLPKNVRFVSPIQLHFMFPSNRVFITQGSNWAGATNYYDLNIKSTR